MLVVLTAKSPNCGKLLRASFTTLFEKSFRGTRLIVVSNGKNKLDWTIRIQAPNSLEKWRRFRDCMEVGQEIGLRYSPTQFERVVIWVKKEPSAYYYQLLICLSPKMVYNQILSLMQMQSQVDIRLE